MCQASINKKVKWSESHSVTSHALQPHGLFSPWNSPGWNTGVGCHALLQGIFLTQESNQGLLHCRRILHQLSYQGSPKKWVAFIRTQKYSRVMVFGGWWAEAGGRTKTWRAVGNWGIVPSLFLPLSLALIPTPLHPRLALTLPSAQVVKPSVQKAHQ